MSRAALIGFIGLTLAYAAACAAYAVAVSLRASWREPAAAAFAISFGAYFVSTILLGSRLAADVVRTSRSPAWIAAFFLFGGLAIPVYYFVRRPGPPEPRTLRPVGVALTAYVVLVLTHASWTILIALTSVPMTRAYRTIAGGEMIATWAVWLIAIAAVIRLPWSVPRKLLWSIFIIVLPFIAAPLRYYGYHA